MYFFRPKDFGAPIEICPGCTTRVVVGGDRIMFSFVEIEGGVMSTIHSPSRRPDGCDSGGNF